MWVCIMNRNRKGARKAPHNQSSRLLYHGPVRVASIEDSPDGPVLLRTGMKPNAWLPLDGRRHISFQRHHLEEAQAAGVRLVRLVGKDGETWEISFDEYMESAKAFDHPTRGRQLVVDQRLFVHSNPLQGRLL